MLPDTVRPISVDDHLIEPPDLWTSRLPGRYRDDAPQVVKNDAGEDVWRYAGALNPIVALNAVAGLDVEDFSTRNISYSDMRPGVYNARERIRDMDADGLHGSICFPTFARFAGHRFLEGEDRELAGLCVRAYNDFMLDEWCAAAPDRLIPMTILPLWDSAAAVAEVHRCAGRGAKAIALSENPTKMGLPSIHSGYWDPVFGAIEETDLAVCMHIGSSSQVITSSTDAPYAVHVGLIGLNSMVGLTDLLFSHVLHDFPTLRIALSEGGAGWVPYLLERCDYTWERHRHHSGLRADITPSELFTRNIWVCIITDELAVDLRHRIGVDKIMWECDYPHSDSLWPDSRKALLESLHDVPENEALAIAEDNARSVFRFPAVP